jgi:hypothetical protein
MSTLPFLRASNREKKGEIEKRQGTDAMYDT